MRKQIDGQISLFDYMAEDEKNVKEKQLNYQKTEQKRKDRTQNKVKKEGQESVLSSVSFFMQCSSCWCSDCRHNEKLDAVPRDFSGVKKACPSCEFCLQSKKAEVCEIGSYDNGCKLRASEEGIMP